MIKTSLPSCHSIFSFQHCNFFHTLCLISAKAFNFDLPTTGGRPRYFSYCWVSSTPHNFRISVCFSVDTFLLKTMVVFVLFFSCPDALSYLSKMRQTRHLGMCSDSDGVRTVPSDSDSKRNQSSTPIGSRNSCYHYCPNKTKQKRGGTRKCQL